MFQFSIATLNTWHGLNGTGKIAFGNLESRTERIERLNRQMSALQLLSPTILLLQEVNPLPFRAHWYAQKLNKLCEHSTCNAGIKLGIGAPYNLSEGLCILFPKNWKGEFLGKKKLSGESRLLPFQVSEVSTPFLSFQLHESRYAMAVRIHVPEHLQEQLELKSLICASTHLHHAHGLTHENKLVLQHYKTLGLPSEEENSILKIFQESNARRIKEVEVLSQWITNLALPHEPIFLGGDFNSEANSDPIQILKAKGWQDIWEKNNETNLENSYTWEPLKNPLAGRSKDFQFVGSSLSEQAKEFFIEIDKQPRRIDYLFYYPAKNSSFQMKENLNIQRFGVNSSEVKPISDHYGVIGYLR
jgi:Endonuclease/Exonuclease/phosphatase family